MEMSTISEDKLSTGTSCRKFWPILTELKTKTHFKQHLGKKIHRHFCYLPKILCRLNLSLYWKVSQPNFHAKLRKTIKWATKMAIKIKAKRKRRKEKRDRNRFAKFCLMWMREKQKPAYFQLAEN